jgi:small basic protein
MGPNVMREDGMQKTGRSVGVKLGIGFLLVALVAVGLAIYSYFALVVRQC